MFSMKRFSANWSRSNAFVPVLVFLILAMTLVSVPPAFGHGDEDHGEKKVAVAATANGVVSRTARLGDVEILFKHSILEPDTPVSARLFLTQFATNEPVSNAEIKMEMESANGKVTEVAVEKSDAPGSYVLKMPALPGGAYVLRVVSTSGGKAETLTFSDIEIAHQEATASQTAVGSWTDTGFTALLVLVGLGLFGGLVFFSARMVRREPLGDETVSV